MAWVSLGDFDKMKRNIKQMYDGSYWDVAHKSPFIFKKLKTVYDLIKLRKTGALLDCGCGEGDSLKFFDSHGYSCYGFDVSSRIVDQLLRQGCEVSKGDLEVGVPFTFKFDVITCLDVVEHIYDTCKVLGNLKSSLKDDGVLVISIPNDFTIFHRVKILFGIIYYEIYSSHIHYFAPKQFRRILNDCGFKIVEEKNISVNVPVFNPVLDVLANVIPNLFAQSYVFVVSKT